MKVYEKAVSRRLAPIFEPKATIAQLHDHEDLNDELDEPSRRRLVDDYLEVKIILFAANAPSIDLVTVNICSANAAVTFV